MRRRCTRPRRSPRPIRWYNAGHGLNPQALVDRHRLAERADWSRPPGVTRPRERSHARTMAFSSRFPHRCCPGPAGLRRVRHAAGRDRRPAADRPGHLPPRRRATRPSWPRSARSSRPTRRPAQFSGAVLVTRDGRTLFEGAYGLADRERGVPNTLLTQFRVGSMYKMVTAVATLQLVQAGTLRLDAPLGTYLPDYPNADVASKVTPHHLLTHTGGTGDIFGPLFTANRTELRTTGDYLRLYGTRGLQFAPGAQHVYSNYGFMLLGALIERVSGTSYDDHVAARVLAPAGMTATGTAPEDSLVPGRSVGYMRQGVRRARVERADAPLPRHARGGRVLHRGGLRALRRRGPGAPAPGPGAHGAAPRRQGRGRPGRSVRLRVHGPRRGRPAIRRARRGRGGDERGASRSSRTAGTWSSSCRTSTRRPRDRWRPSSSTACRPPRPPAVKPAIAFVASNVSAGRRRPPPAP